MDGPFHPGELEAQQRVGVADLAEKVGRIIGSTIPPVAAEFVSRQSFLVVATTDGRGEVHIALLRGRPGFASVVDGRLHLHPEGGHVGDVRRDLAADGSIGLLAINFESRRRMRLNGTAVLLGESILVSPREVYSNCPQYIHERADAIGPTGRTARESASLSPAQIDFIRRADTFFIASAHRETGADASHRGGRPGFVSVEGGTLRFPDFKGNNMFNTIGNLLVDPRSALLFVDFATGSTLRLLGHAAIDWREPRSILFEIERVIENAGEP